VRARVWGEVNLGFYERDLGPKQPKRAMRVCECVGA
jgi:hypothetical protein